MYHLDGRWRRQSLVYFGHAKRLVRECRGPAFRRGAMLCSRAATLKYLVSAND